MSTPEPAANSALLPDYLANAQANPPEKRAPWYKNTAPTYAGIMLWFVFWQDVVNSPSPGGGLAAGIGVALLGIGLAALICHFLFFLVPGLLGFQTGLPLYIVGSSTFGTTGGFLMPGFLMGLLQFGWLGVNIYFSSQLIAQAFLPDGAGFAVGSRVIMVLFGILAAFVGLKGIQYVAKVATYLPLIPLVILLVMFARTAGGLGGFSPEKLVDLQTAAPAPVATEITLEAAREVAAARESTGAEKVAPQQKEAVVKAETEASGAERLGPLGVLAFLMTYIVGFFATAGAAGVDFGLGNRDRRDVQLGGLVGIALATVFTAGLATLIVAGTYGSPALSARAVQVGKGELPLNAVSLFPVVFGGDLAKWLMVLLAVSAFPPACFSSFIAANSFKTTLPKVNPFLSVGLGAAVSILLAVTGVAGQVVQVFQIIGASFGPICGAMTVDYLLSGRTWPGPRAGFNPAGWISWALGFLVGILPFLKVPVPAAPVAAYLVGAVVYFLCAKLGLLSRVMPMPTQVPAS